MKRPSLFFLTFLFLISSNAFSDEIIFKDGKRISGKLLEYSDRSFKISIQQGYIVRTYPASEIKKIIVQRAEDYEVKSSKKQYQKKKDSYVTEKHKKKGLIDSILDSMPKKEGGSREDPLGVYVENPNTTFTVIEDNISVLDTSSSPTNKSEWMEHLVTVLTVGDEIQILELHIFSTKILVLKHNNSSVYWKGWVPSDLLKKSIKAKK